MRVCINFYLCKYKIIKRLFCVSKGISISGIMLFIATIETLVTSQYFFISSVRIVVQLDQCRHSSMTHHTCISNCC